jgi:TolB-like protein/class 3 adenylate cyclase/Tfp pilus assembly protein PilF
MVEKHVQRRLAAIMAVDVVGYSRLMEMDEAGTFVTLKEKRRNVLMPLVAHHHGRIFKLMGDGVLVDFASATDAVQCAIDLQRQFNQADLDKAASERIILRIGINLGEVIVEGSDVYGDGVNIAARLESIAPEGGIAVSGTVRDHVGNKSPVNFHDLGERTLKNIERPVHAFSIVDDVAALQPHGVNRLAASAAVPAIAVLPFTNMSGDASQEYLSEGITEDIITELSRFRNILVIARNSSFSYKGKGVKVETIGRDLGVGFVVEGSVRRLDGRLRITAQLIDVANGGHIWAERYDRPLDDIFAVQDDVVRCIVGTIEGRLAKAILEKLSAKPRTPAESYDYVLKARQLLGNYEADLAEPLLYRALEIDPSYAQAHAWLAMVHWVKFFDDHSPATIDVAASLARMAVALDDGDSMCHAQLAFAYLFQRRFDMADIHSRRALEINPADMLALSMRAHWLCRVGQLNESLSMMERLLRHDPFPPSWYWESLAVTLITAGRFEEAISAIARLNHFFWWDYCYLAICHAQLGRVSEANAEVARALEIRPNTTISDTMKGEPYKNPVDAQIMIEGMRTAGLPE